MNLNIFQKYLKTKHILRQILISNNQKVEQSLKFKEKLGNK